MYDKSILFHKLIFNVRLNGLKSVTNVSECMRLHKIFIFSYFINIELIFIYNNVHIYKGVRSNDK